MIRRKRISCWAALVAGLVLALTTGHRSNEGLAAANPELGEMAVANAQLDALAQELAQLLAEAGFRGYLRSEIAKSKNNESILDLEPFLARAARRPDARPGLDNVGRLARDASASAKSATRSALDGLDLYLPVDAHRAKWKGGKDFLVAFAPVNDEEDIRQIVAYDVATGNRVTLDPNRTPAQIVMVIVPEEHESHEPLQTEPPGESLPASSVILRSVRDDSRGRSPDFVGRNAPEPAEAGEQGNSWIGIRRLYIRDDKEDWYRGDAEIFAVYSQREGNFCKSYRRGYSNSVLWWVEDEGVRYKTWEPSTETCGLLGYNDALGGIDPLPMRSACWYFSSQPPNSSYTAFRLDIQEYDGGDTRLATFKLWPGTPMEVSCDFTKRDGDDPIDHGYNYRNAFDYYRDYRQDLGNAIVDFYKIH